MPGLSRIASASIVMSMSFTNDDTAAAVSIAQRLARRLDTCSPSWD
jgi:hypothetical protein